MKGMTASSIAGIFALAAFAVALVAGTSGGNPAVSVLMRALIAMLLCYPVGYAVGLIAHRVIQEQIEAYVEAHPVPMTPHVDDENMSVGGVERSVDEEVIVA